MTKETKGHRDVAVSILMEIATRPTTESKNVRAYKVTGKDCWIQTENKSQPIIISLAV